MESLDKLRKTATSLRRKHGQVHVEYANTTLALADHLIQQKQFAEAEQLYRQSAEIYEELGLGHELLLAIALRSLSHALHAQGKSAESEPLLSQAHEIIAQNS
jgi:tetratricopeptide (TPR) repeat protein